MTTLPSAPRALQAATVSVSQISKSCPQWLWCSSWVTVHHKNLPGLLGIACCYKKPPLQVVEVALAAQAPRAPLAMQL